ncbi:uncharacterized protein Z518_05703 [Rhinocladiella mackenziei CBS 650.93]|uniref:4,5-dihydroxyphthalate decarboxylase n=1 Tax=Rhinocladiella mackenziei CBS 650.93 TaxID=1442369 RepID=A0A0D2FRN9_9EURO|nr:uncharacterized protein Z518_05703 [Rhinocladiella mackenziei CBS 650.93]KIX04832.1 hypothetical protein Z518_05703 [Rhinocladiella mackenziei CBS 650.93]
MVIKLTFACSDYDRMKAIEDGRVRPEGIDLTFLNYRVEETFFRQLRFKEFDVSELSLSSYVLTLNHENPPFIAIPVFPSRFFRHQSIYINTRSGIKKAEDLRGKKIGIPEYQMTASVWQRGLMEEEFGVPISTVHFYVGNIEPSQEQRKSKVAHSVPANTSITAIKPGQNLSQMLEDGELDALFAATKPSSFNRCEHVTYLFQDFEQVEAGYFQRTNIFPIMHVVALKREVYETNPWVAKTLQKAFATSLDIAYEAILERGALRYILPWLEHHVEKTKTLMGQERWWQDGFVENRHVLDKFLEYSFNQGLAKRRFTPEELFAPNTLESFVV